MEEQKIKIDADVAMRYLAERVLEIPKEETATGEHDYMQLAVRVYLECRNAKKACKIWRRNAWGAVITYTLVFILRMIVG